MADSRRVQDVPNRLAIAESRRATALAARSPVEVSRQIGIHHTTIYRFLNDTRGLSHDAQDRLAKYLKLRLVRDKR